MPDLDWVRGLLGAATPYTLAVNVPYALAFALVATEVAWLARRSWPARTAILRSAATATAMALGALAVGIGYTAALRVLWELVATVRWEGAAGFWRSQPAVGAAVTFVAWDFAGWVYHVIGHRTRVGWAAHQAHHSGEEYDATLGLRQSWTPFHGLLFQPLLALAGFDLEVVFVCAAVSNCWQVLEHTSVPVRFPNWFEAHVMTPAAHRHHHGRDGGLVNMGPFFTWWDRLAGTWVPADHPAPATYGPPARASANPVRIELAGWLALATRHPAPRRAWTNSITWAPMMTGRTIAHNVKAPSSSAASELRQASPSSTRMTIHKPSAVPDPRPALGARMNPNTRTATDTASRSRRMTRTNNSVPPSRETVSASTSRSPLRP